MAFKMKGAPFAKGKKTTIAGQSIKNENGKYSDADTGAPIADPKGKLENRCSRIRSRQRLRYEKR